MSSDHDEVNDAQGSSRRALLKGAVAVGVGAAVYTAPVVGTVPAYATHGLSSWRTTSGDLCLWFSPNRGTAPNGQWEDYAAGVTSNGTVPATLSRTYTVGGVGRTVIVQGDPNNRFLAQAGTGADNGHASANTGATFCFCTTGAENTACTGCADPWEFYGGGMNIRLTAPTCEFVVQRLLCNQQSQNACDTTNETAPPAPWANGSSLSAIDQRAAPNGNVGGGRFQGDATRRVYYHTGRTGYNQGNRCKFQIVFRIRCA